MASPRFEHSKFQLFPVDARSTGYCLPHPFRIPSAVPNTSFSPISPPTRAVPSSPTPLYTWNTASLMSQEPFRPQTMERVTPLPSLAPYRYSGSSGSTGAPVELLVTNLDQNIEANEMKRILFSAFREHVMVLHVSVTLQPDGTLKAIVRVSSTQDAQLAISQLQRRKIGFKRILISYTSNERAPPLNLLRYEVTNLLSDVPSNRIPLFKFRELFENRYHRSIGTCDLHKLKDIVHITDDKCGRMISFQPNYRATPSPDITEGPEAEGLERSYCPRHTHHSHAQGWAETDNVYPLPNVHISLKSLSPRVHTLLDSHQGFLPLSSFCMCYEAEFGELQTVSADSLLAFPGVCLEHLITCIPGVQITKSAFGVKRVRWLLNKDMQPLDSRNISPSLVGQVSLFCREIVDLLKNYPHCSIQLHKFIPLYHHHFGRQCRVSDYGYTKLIDLLEAVPHVVQILGQGQNRMLTLTHRSQMKRFASDLLRVLKSQPNKQLSLTDLPTAYEKCLGKPLDITNYGICVLDDIVGELSDNSVVVTRISGEICLSIPKREQTAEEMVRTREFSQEVITILGYTPTCSMLFNKFVPAYHHHYGKQCKVAEFGFSKLIELFEAIPDILEISGSGEEKVINLTPKKRLRVLAQRMVSLVCSVGGIKQFLPLEDIDSAYKEVNGYSLHLEDFGIDSLNQMAEVLQDTIKIQKMNNTRGLTLVDQKAVQVTKQQLQCLLMENSLGQTTIANLQQLYQTRYKTALDPGLLSQCLSHFTKLENDVIRLTPLQLLFRNLLQLLQENDGQLLLCSVEAAFMSRFGVPCQPALYSFQSLTALVSSSPEYFIVKGKKKKLLCVNRNTAELDFFMRTYALDKPNQTTSKNSPSQETDSNHQPVQNTDERFQSFHPLLKDTTDPCSDVLPPSQGSWLPYASLFWNPNDNILPGQGQALSFLLPRQQEMPFQFASSLAWISTAVATEDTLNQSRGDISMDSALDESETSESFQDSPTRQYKRNRIAAQFSVH